MNVYFNSDQGSNSFDDFTWGENCAKTPEISSVLSTVMEDDRTQFVEDGGPTKKAKSGSDDFVSGGDGNNVSSHDLFQMPYLDSNWDASIDAFINGDDGPREGGGGNVMDVDLWSFDDVTAMLGCAY